jgi:uncharacterized protein YcfL
MKKLSILLVTLFTLAGCDRVTTMSEDTMMLQTKYSTVYRIEGTRYIVCDSSHVYDVRVTSDGQIRSTVKIK